MNYLVSVEDTLARMAEALSKGAPADGQNALAKSWVQSGSATSGLTAYDLEAPAKTLYPVLTPLRNMIPRVSGAGGIQANWRAITAINSANIDAALSEGNRGGIISTTVMDYMAAYRGLGLDDNVTFEADYAAKGFDDVKARATEGLLRSLMIQEEKYILAGNGTLAMGTAPTPSLADLATGGTLAANTLHYCNVVGLDTFGYMRNSAATTTLTVQTTRTNADGTSDVIPGGASAPSAQASITTANDGNATHRVSATVAAMRGAVAYAWYFGTTTGDAKFAGVTTINSNIFSALPSGGNQSVTAVAGDHSANSLAYDGLMTIAMKSGTNGYWGVQATGTAGTGTPLTSDGAGGIIEFDTALQHFWDNYKLSPTHIWVSSREMATIRKRILAGGTSASMTRFTFNVQQGQIIGGTMVKGYINPFTMGEGIEIPISIHPNLSPGTVLFTTRSLPYPLSGVTDVNVIRTRQEYYQLEWPLRTRKYEYGVYCDEVLQSYFPPSLGVITNIAAD